MKMQPRKGCPPRGGSRRGGCPPLEATVDARLFRALSDPTRIHILVRLARCCGPQTVSQAAADCAVDMSVVSRHLGILRDAGIVTMEKRGREVLCAVRYAEVARSLRTLADALEACCPDDPPR